MCRNKRAVEVLEQLGFSGSDWTLRAGDTLIVWRLDRLGRSLRNLLDIADLLQERGVRLRSVSDHIVTSTAAG